jgi:hypothetical protein
MDGVVTQRHINIPKIDPMPPRHKIDWPAVSEREASVAALREMMKNFEPYSGKGVGGMGRVYRLFFYVVICIQTVTLVEWVPLPGCKVDLATARPLLFLPVVGISITCEVFDRCSSFL